MPVEWSAAGTAAAAVLATYLIHSTLLLGGAWLLLRLGRARSAALRERVWKTAAVAALVTAPLQVALDVDTPAWTIRLPSSEPSAPVAEHDVGKTPDIAPALVTGRHAVPIRPSTAPHHRESARRSASPTVRARELRAHHRTGTTRASDDEPFATALAAATSPEREPRSASAWTFMGSLRALVSRGFARDALLAVGALIAEDAGPRATSDSAEERGHPPTKETRRGRRTAPAERPEDKLAAARDALGEELELLAREIEALQRELDDTATPAKRALLRRIDERWEMLRDVHRALDSRLQLETAPANPRTVVPER